MLDWNAYRKELKGRIGEIGKLSPDTVKGYATWPMPVPRPTTWMPRPVS